MHMDRTHKSGYGNAVQREYTVKTLLDQGRASMHVFLGYVTLVRSGEAQHLERAMPCRSRSKRNDQAAAGARRVPGRSHSGGAAPRPPAYLTNPSAKALVAQVCLEASYRASQPSPCQNHSKQQVCATTALPFNPSGQAQDGERALMSA